MNLQRKAVGLFSIRISSICTQFVHSSSENSAPGSQVGGIQEMPTVLPSSHMTSENSIMKSACSHARSTTKPYTVIPARLFSRYVTAFQFISAGARRPSATRRSSSSKCSLW